MNEDADLDLPRGLRPRWRRRLATSGLVGAAVYLLFFATVNVADRLLLWPSRHPLPTNGAVERMIPDGEGAIQAFSARNRETGPPEAYVLSFYGNADRADSHVTGAAQSYGAHAVELWGVNYPGFGASVGRASLRGVARAAERAFDVMASEAGGKPIFVTGASMGTVAALRVAATRKVAGAFLYNGPPLAQLIRGEHGWWNLWLLAIPISLQVPREADSVANARLARAPAVFVTGERDTLVPPEYQRLVVEAYGGEKKHVVAPGANHDGGISDATREEISQAFERVWDRAVPK